MNHAEIAGEAPAEYITADQIVALNIRHWRRELGWTQEYLGGRLGWSAANVSAAERSAEEGRERRRFDAGTLTELSLALGVPLIALFLPPLDDGGERRYLIPAGPGDPGGDTTMEAFMELVVMTDTDSESHVMDAYRHRLLEAAGRYLDPIWSREIARWLRMAEGSEARSERADRLRARQAELLRTAAELEDLADAIDPKHEKEGDGGG